jgi:hypothetical protein
VLDRVLGRNYPVGVFSCAESNGQDRFHQHGACYPHVESAQMSDGLHARSGNKGSLLRENLSIKCLHAAPAELGEPFQAVVMYKHLPIIPGDNLAPMINNYVLSHPDIHTHSSQ